MKVLDESCYKNHRDTFRLGRVILWLLSVVSVRAVLCRGFKALKQIVKLRYKMGTYEDMLSDYK